MVLTLILLVNLFGLFITCCSGRKNKESKNLKNKTAASEIKWKNFQSKHLNQKSISMDSIYTKKKLVKIIKLLLETHAQIESDDMKEDYFRLNNKSQQHPLPIVELVGDIKIKKVNNKKNINFTPHDYFRTQPNNTPNTFQRMVGPKRSDFA
ncbi:Hypothetical protein SRAE_1000318600 [Strongyloides ratti]|uniref:Uncharacterized protein n=1 Tax=Strongyloides ratti TaxID=34506 RepID=A0A090L9W6_STRRB|nr:Hypothetical protein SRAE_1000318600 [Strongyloides ratti]CEF64933.1 Hypothetical protein SRAE_1000318600 [Strongyloides ratti]